MATLSVVVGNKLKVWGKEKNKWCQLLTLPAGCLGDFILLSVMLTSTSTVYLCIWLSSRVSTFRSLRVGLSLWACHLRICLSASFYLCLLPVSLSHCPSLWQSVWWFHPSPADCLLSLSSGASPSAVYPALFPRHRLPWMIFCLFLWLSYISTIHHRPPPNSTEPSSRVKSK